MGCGETRGQRQTTKPLKRECSVRGPKKKNPKEILKGSEGWGFGLSSEVEVGT